MLCLIAFDESFQEADGLAKVVYLEPASLRVVLLL